MTTAPSDRFGMVLPTGGDPADVPLRVDQPFGQIDELAAIDDQGVYSARPAAALARRGMYYWATDRQLLYRCTGTGWEAIQPVRSPVPGLPPASSVDLGERRLLTTATWAHWELELRAENTWVFAGGAPLESRNTIPRVVPINTTSTAVAVVDVPLAGSYTVDVTVQASTSTGNRSIDWEVSLQQGGSDVGDLKPREVIPESPDGSIGSSFGCLSGKQEMSLSAGLLNVVLRPRAISASGATALNFSAAVLGITPVRVLGPA